MARLYKKPTSQKSEPTIALINVVFLLLIFFLVAGTLSQAVDKRISLIPIDEAIDVLPDDVLSMRANGELIIEGVTVSIENIVPANNDEVRKLRIAPDQDLPAGKFVGMLAKLKDAGWTEIVVIGEKSE